MSNTPDTTDEESDAINMDPEIRERRLDTWDMLVVKGLDFSKVVSRLAEQYDTTENAIKTDISRMDNWLPKLDIASQKSGVSRLRELRQNRQRLQMMAMEAHQQGDLEKELKIRRRIDKAVETDVKLSQSLGLAEKEPEQVEVGWKEYITSEASGSPDEAVEVEVEAVDEDEDDDTPAFLPDA